MVKLAFQKSSFLGSIVCKIAIVALFCVMARSVYAKENFVTTVREGCVQTAHSSPCTSYRQILVTLKQNEEFWLKVGFTLSKKSPCARGVEECSYYQFGAVFRVDADDSQKLVYHWGDSIKHTFSAGSATDESIPGSWFSGESQVLVKGNYLIVLLLSKTKDNTGDLLFLQFPISIQ